MENATKALIIAGAVLISILLISVGIMVFNASSDPINQAQNSSEQQAVQMFNEAFSQYLGTNITGQQAKSLISAVNGSNAKNADHQIKLEGMTKVSQISTKNHYDAEEFDEKDADGNEGQDGYIDRIVISEHKKTTP